MLQLQRNLDAVSKVLSLNLTAAEVEMALRKKRLVRKGPTAERQLAGRLDCSALQNHRFSTSSKNSSKIQLER
jgi:hypothetical protein